MKNDLKTNQDIIFDMNLAATGAKTSEDDGTILDMSNYRSAAFVLVVATMVATSTVVMKLQYSDDGTTWTDEDGATGNDTTTASILAATGAGAAYELNIVKPQAQYYQAVATVGTAAMVGSVLQIAGPKLSV